MAKGKIATVAELIKSNPGMVKKDMVALVVKELGVPKQNAYVYIFNATKKLAKGDVPKAVKAKVVKASRSEVNAKADAEVSRIKQDRLKMIKDVADRRKADKAEMEAERKEALESVDSFMEEADAYVKTLTSPTRKFLLGAE